MISDFQLLAQKVEQLVATANRMRAENTTLRAQVAELTAKINQAQERVAVVLEKLPMSEESE